MASNFIESLSLNKEQKSAVLYDDGPQLVFAGAGTGKTKVLTSKIAWLIKERGLRPNEIFAATFTNKAAREMRERISNLVGDSCDGMWIGTFHSLCVRILRREAERLDYSPWFTIYDSSDQLSLVKSILKEQLIDENSMQPKSVLRIISTYKNDGVSVDELENKALSFYDREVVEIYRKYQEALKKSDAMDFDDLIFNVVKLFSQDSEILLKYQSFFSYILVDEYQDTNKSQFNLIRLLASSGNSIFAVGDDDQSIYGWRGAQIENILNFEKCFAGTQIFKLERNYRSTKPIIEFSNAIISRNSIRSKKTLWTDLEGSSDVILRGFSDDRAEAKKISTEIRRDLDIVTITPKDVAILYRTNAQSRLFEEALRRDNIPYVLVGGTSFYDRKEVKDILAYLKLLVNPKDNISAQRIINVPARGIGAKSQEKIANVAKEKDSSFFEAIMDYDAAKVLSGKASKGCESFASIFNYLRELVEGKQELRVIITELLSEVGYIDAINDGSVEADNRIENINELINAISEWNEAHSGGTLHQFLEEITLASDIDSYENEEALSLMTLHSAKGLEFKRVYLVGLEDGLIPSRQNFDNNAKLEEERRLLYVGVTRAKEELICSYAENRMRFGSIIPSGLTRFLTGMPSSLYRFIDETARYSTVSSNYNRESLAGTKSPRGTVKKVSEIGLKSGRDIANLSNSNKNDSYRVGQRVEQSKYGIGKVVAVSGFGTDLRVTVLFESGLRKQLLAKFAKLKIL